MRTGNTSYTLSGRPAFRLVLAPADLDISAVAVPDLATSYSIDPLVSWYFRFTSLGTITKRQAVDERGTQHKELDGFHILTPSKYRWRWHLLFETVEIGTVVDGVLTEMNEFEFLTYLNNYKHLFSRTGNSQLWLRQHDDPTKDVEIEEEDFTHQDPFIRCVLLNASFAEYPENNPEYMSADLMLESYDLYDKQPYTIAKDRPRF